MKNPEYLPILEKEAIKNGKIDDDVQVEQVSVMNKNDALRAKGVIAHSGVTLIPSVQSYFFDKSGNLKEKYIKRGYSNPHKFPDGRLGWVEAGFKGEKSKGEPKGKLVVRINPPEDVIVNDNLLGSINCHSMTGTLTQGFEPYGNKRNNLPKQRGGEISDKDYNKYMYSPMYRIAPGLGNIIPDKYFRKNNK
ncbi:hypothetical protein LDK10_04605 [Fusobacterium animalis]